MINLWFRLYRKLVYPNHKSFLSVVFFVIIILSGFIISSSKIFAEGYPKYGPNEVVTIGEFIYDDNFQPATSTCSIIIQNTAGSVIVPTTTLTTSTNGWQFYTFGTTSTEGTWPATILCGSLAGGDLAKLDKTFITGNTSVSTSSIASAIWSTAVRTLTSGASIADDIWAASSRTLSSFGSIVTDIWSSPSRTLTSFGTLLADIWSDVASPNRRLTSGTLADGGILASQAFVSSTIQSATSSIISEVIANRSLISALNNISAADVWAYSGRTLTDYATSSISAAVWTVPTSTFTQFGSIGKLIASNLDAQISSRGTSTLSAADVWNAATRSLTDYSTTSIALGVWANSARTLTSYGNDITAADVWNALTSTLNTAGSIGKQLTDNINVSSSLLLNKLTQNQSLISGLNNISAADVWSYASRTVSSSVEFSTSSLASIWSVGTSTLSSFGSIGKLIVDNLDAQVSSRGTSNLTAADVWQAATRSLTDYATSSIVAAIWSTPTSSLTTVGSIGKQLADNTTVSSSKLYNEVLVNRTLINALNNISAADVWSYAGRNLTGSVDIATTSRQAIWSVATSTLTSFGTIGKLVVDNLDAQVSTRGTSNLTAADVWVSANRTLSDYATSSITTAIWSNAARTLTSYGNDITAADVWNVLSSGLTTVGSIGKQLADNVDTQVSTRGTSNLTASDVWQSPTRSLTDYATSSITTAIWSNAARTLTSYGNDITAADVWNVLSSGLTTVGSIGKQLTDNTTVSSSRLLSELLANRALINALNNISAGDVWSYANRTVTSSVQFSTSSLQAMWSVATSTLGTIGSIGKLVVDNLDAQVSSRGLSNLTAADVWQSGARSLTDYSTSTIVSAVWSNASRTLTNYGNDITAADVWNVLTSTLNTVGSIGKQLATNVDVAVSTRASLLAQGGGWTVRMSDVDSVSAGKTYRTKVYIFDTESLAAAPQSVPTITLYDASRNVVASGVAMNAVATGIYEYTYSVANNAEGGLWEAVISTEVESGQFVETNDYWLVAASPAQVIINSMSDTESPSVAANVTITNEGLSGYEYHYEWCVVTDINNSCGGNNDTYYASAAKFINPGEDFNTTLTATVPSAGTYYFKMIVYFGTESSGASRSFTATAAAVNPPPTRGGGGGGGAVLPPAIPEPVPTTTVSVGACSGADFNHDTKVNSIDFSILLAFWKTPHPFRNPCADINLDKKVDSVDFSILMYEWGRKK